jgi:hypothetical protein
MTLMEAFVTGGLFAENSDVPHKGFPGGQKVPNGSLRQPGIGLLATALATVLGLLISTAGASLSSAETLNAIIFALIGAGIAWGGEQLRQSRIQASTSTADAPVTPIK